MKIIVATPLYPPEIERLSAYSKNVAQYLQADNQVTILAYANKTEDNSDINILTVDKAQPLFIRLFKYTWSLLKLSKDNDIIYVQNAVASALPAIIVKYLTKIPVVINFSEDESWKRAISLRLSKQSLENFLAKPKLNRDIRKIKRTQSWVLRRASKVLVSLATLAKLISQTYKVPTENIIVSYTPEDRKQKLPFDAIKIPQQIFIKGDLVDWTGIKGVIETVAELKEKYKDIKLIISGDGPNKSKLIKLSKDLAVYDNIKFLGKISKAEDWQLLKTSQIYVHNFLDFDPADQITQSWLAETPVVARDTEFNREILSDNKYGILFKDDDLVNKIEQIFEDSNLAQELINKANKNLEDGFSWKVHIAKLNKILQSLVKK